MPTYIVTSDSKLERVPAPNLPLAPTSWNQQFQDQFANVLRLYFNRLDNYLARLVAVLDSDFNSYIKLPYGAFHQDGVTTLSTGISNNSTTPIQVASTSDFPTSGYLLIGSEIIQYTTKTSTTFDGTITRGVLGTTNVAHLAGVYISEVQGVASSSTAGVMQFNNTDYSSGVAIDSVDQTKIVCSVSALYNLQFSVQLLNFTSAEDNVTIWFVLNGHAVSASASVTEVNAKHGSGPGASIMTVNILQPLKAGDYVQLNWASKTGNTVVATYPPETSPVTPLSPAVIFTATFVSAYPG